MTPATAHDALEAQVLAQMQAQTHAMLRHALANGLELPPRLLSDLRGAEAAAGGAAGEAARGAAPAAAHGPDLARLAETHAQLARLVAPALPGTLCLLQRQVERGGFASALGPLDNIRWLTVAAIVFVLSFMLIGMSPEINAENLAQVTYGLRGTRQLVVMAFLLSAAGMGSTFQALFRALDYVQRATYDPVHDASYWIRVGLGLVAGLLLATLTPLGDGQEVSSSQAQGFGRPVLALLGGFSVQLVHRVLQRMVNAVQSLFEGDPGERQRQRESLSQAAAQQDVSQARIELAAELVQLRNLVAQGASPDQLHAALGRLAGGLLGATEAAATPTAAPDPRGSHSG